MVFTNARLFLGERGFVTGSFRVRDGRFCEVLTEEIPEEPDAFKAPEKVFCKERKEISEEPDALKAPEKVLCEKRTGIPGRREIFYEEDAEGCVDLRGFRVLPGLVDIHIHGCRGKDFSDGDLVGLMAMGRYLASRGVTAFAPTSMTLPRERLEEAFRTAVAYTRNPPSDGARIIGIHMEGPYFSEKKKGAQNSAHLRLPDAEEVLSLQEKCCFPQFADSGRKVSGSEFFSAQEKCRLPQSADAVQNFSGSEFFSAQEKCRLPQIADAGQKFSGAEHLSEQEKCHHLLRFVDVAPELPGAVDFVRKISKICKVSIAHTNASYSEAVRAFDAGASHVTHLFNGMQDLLHREPGIVGAAFDRKHVTAELIGDGLHNHPCIIRIAFRLFPGRLCLVSDALRCAGMPDGEYELGGQKIVLAGGEARLPDGTLAGASTDLFEDLVRVIRFGVPETEVILAATETPAVAAGIFDELGSLEPGKCADFLVCDDDWNIRQVWLGGRAVRM